MSYLIDKIDNIEEIKMTEGEDISEYYEEEENEHLDNSFNLQQKKLNVSVNISLKMRDFCYKLALPLCERLDCNKILELIK